MERISTNGTQGSKVGGDDDDLSALSGGDSPGRSQHRISPSKQAKKTVGGNAASDEEEEYYDEESDVAPEAGEQV